METPEHACPWMIEWGHHNGHMWIDEATGDEVYHCEGCTYTKTERTAAEIRAYTIQLMVERIMMSLETLKELAEGAD